MMRMNYSTQKIVVPVMIVGLGNMVFVRQLKLIWQNQKLDVKNLSSIVSLLCILFEHLGCAIKLHAKFADEVTELQSLDPRNYLFNGQES